MKIIFRVYSVIFYALGKIPKYEFYENQENHIEVEFEDIKDPRKNPRIHPNYDFRPKTSSLNFKIKNSKFT